MKNSFYPLLLVVSLGLAYWASLPTKRGNVHRELWLETNPNAEYQIKYTDTKKITTVKGDWVTVEKIVDNTPMPPMQFKSSTQLNRVTDKLLKLFAEKVIGDAKNLNLADYELDKDNKYFEIGESDSFKKFVIGKRSFQTSNIYVLDVSKQKVILINREPINLLRNPKARLFESHPYKFKLSDDVSSVVILKNGKELTMNLAKNEKNQILWTKPGDKEPLQSEGSWISSLLKLKITKYPIESERKKLEKLDNKFQVKFQKDGNKVEILSFYKWENDMQKEESYWIKSDYLGTFGMVDSTKAKTLLQDINSFL